MPLKLGSNWKSVGIGTDMRRWAHGNPRVTNTLKFCILCKQRVSRSTLAFVKEMTILEAENERKLMIFSRAWESR